MFKLITSRLLQGLVVLFIVSLLIFALLAVSGGDALGVVESDQRVSEETLRELRRIYGLDQPFSVRYTRWASQVIRGNLGHSYFYKAPVGRIIKERLLNTAALAATALLIAWAISLTLGIAAARHAGTWIDKISSLIVILAASTPRLVLALITLAFIAQTSLVGVGGLVNELPMREWFLRLLPPALVLSVPLLALFLAQTRARVGEMFGQDFVRAARAKGLPERIVLFRHVLRPSLNPLITIFGYSLGGVMSGSVIVETVLSWPGLGQLSVIAVQRRDMPLLMAVVLVTATAVLVGNLVADILQRLNDPRLKTPSR
jgi:peptide/nickel transport system permease protein